MTELRHRRKDTHPCQRGQLLVACATRPIEVLQPIQALAQARLDYLDAVLDYNRSQFRLKRATGQQP